MMRIANSRERHDERPRFRGAAETAAAVTVAAFRLSVGIRPDTESAAIRQSGTSSKTDGPALIPQLSLDGCCQVSADPGRFNPLRLSDP
jgi:hypothetical protein